MKRTLLLIGTITTFCSLSAQNAVHDSVSIGTGYPNEVWYSLNKDEQGMQPRNNWDIAFEIEGIGTSVMINSASNVALWGYPKANKSGWASVDTNGLSTWGNRLNSDTSWSLGAFSYYSDFNNAFDLGWGNYDLSTHEVTGDSLYIIKTANGSYKKIIIESLKSGVYTFKYANLDGSSEVTATIKKSDYKDKNFGYYSIVDNKTLDREPKSIDWDLLFTRYTDFGMQYNVVGVLQNKDILVAQANKITDKYAYNQFGAHPYSSEINQIGYDWKSFNGATYDIKDSLLYFIKKSDGDIWKVIFTGFEMADGKMSFDKQRLVSTSVEDKSSGKTASLSLYPNPTEGSNVVNILYDLPENKSQVILQILDASGRIVKMNNINPAQGFHNEVMSIDGLNAGLYFVVISYDSNRITQRLLVK